MTTTHTNATHGGTFTLPSGRKFRSQSQRRYVVVTDGASGKPRIVRRSDNLLTAIKVAQGTRSSVVVDTTTSETVYPSFADSLSKCLGAPVTVTTIGTSGAVESVIDSAPMFEVVGSFVFDGGAQ